MKISFYELLGLVKDSKAPKKIKDRRGRFYTFDEGRNDYFDSSTGKFVFETLMLYRDKCLDEEIEIIKELENNFTYIYETKDERINANFENIASTLINIIDKINEMSNKRC